MADFIKKLKEFAEEFSEESDYYKQKQKESVVKDIAKIREEETAKPAAQVAAVQQTTQPTDTRTTAQKAAAAQSAYDAYMGSEEQKINQQEANRQAVWAAMDRIFAAGPGVSASDMPLNIVSVNPVDTKQEELKATANYYKTQQQAEENQKVLDAKLAEYETWSAEDKAALDQYMRERDMAQNNLFGAPQFDTYNLNPLVQKMGIGEVREMAEAVQRNRNAKAMEETTAAANKLAEDKPVLGSLASVGANLIGSYAGTVEAAKEAANRTGQFGTLDPNNLGGIGSQFGSTIRQNVSQQIEGENGNWLRKVAAIGYEGVMSAADSTARLAAGGFNPGVSAAIAASGSFNNSLRQYSAQGATPEQAAAAAIVTSGIEYLTEKIPMDELLKVGKGGWKDLLKQAFLTEPTTEEISLFANTAAETLILGKNSDRSQKIGELVANGATYKEAQEQVNKELWKEAAKTYAVSAVSGGVSAGGAQIAEQRAIEKLGAELAKNVVEQARPQPTEQELQLKQATDELLGVSADADNTSSIKDQIRQSQNALNKMEPVANIQTPQGFSDMTKTERKSWVINKLQPTSYKVDRKGFGIIKFAEKQLKAAFNYLKRGSVEEASFEALPYVLEHGTEISSHPAHKNREYGTVTFAAPVVINGKRGNMAVVVKQTTENFYKVHRILTPEGTVFDLSDTKTEAEPSLAGESPEIGSLATPISSASVNNIPETEVNVKGTGAAEQNFSGKAQYQDLLYEGNVQPDRPSDVRPMEVPKTDAEGNPISQVAANVYASQYTPDDLASATEGAIAKGELSYIEITNDAAAEKATRKIESAGGWREAYTQWHDEVRDGKTSAEMAARGAMLLNHAAEVYEQTKATGNEVATKEAKQEWLSILMDVRAMGTNTAQGLQAMRMIRELAPPDKLDFAIASVRRMVADMKLQEEVTIDEDLLNDYRMAETDKERDEIMAEIQQNVADQIPATFLDKWTALRYMNMLGNLKTNVRNVAGNVGSMILYQTKDQIAAVIEKTTGTERTKSNFVGRDLLQACKEDFDLVKAAVNSGGKYSERMAASDEFRQGVMDKRQIFKNPIAEGYRKATNWMMNNQYFGDEAFGRAAYSRALAGYLKAKGYDAETVRNGTVDNKVMNEARAYAIREAQEATFHDNSKLAEIATGIQRKTGVVGQGIMPFTKTPANVLTRAVEFSPLGLVDTAVKAAKKARGDAETTGADVVNSLAKTLTGTALVALGWLMKDQGLLSGGPDEDEEKEQFDDMMGAQNYALTLPDGTNYTIDWLTPAAMPLFMGAQAYDVWDPEDGLTFADLEKVFTSIADPMVQMSMLQGLNDSLDSIKYTDDNLGQFFINAAVSYLTQGLTNTLFGQLERSAEEYRQTTYVDKESQIPAEIQRALGKASQKIPGWDFQQVDYINAFGEQEENEGGFLYNLLSPGYLSNEKPTALSEELYRLRETTGGNVFPQVPEKTISYTDKNGTRHENQQLSAEQYQTMAKTQGQTAKKLLDQIINSQDYKALTAMQQEAAVKAVYEYAAEAGKKAAFPDYYSQADAWISRVDADPVNGIIQRGAEKVLESVVSNAVESLKNGWEVTGAAKKDMNESFDAYDKMSEKAKQELLDQITGDALKYLEAMSGGVSTEQYLQAVEDVKQLKPEEGYSDIRDAQTREAIAGSGLDPEVIDTIMKAYMKDYDPEDESPDKTELRYEYARKELGYSPKEYAAIYRVQADGGKKDEKIAAWMELGYTKQEATILYNLFASTSKQAIDVVKWHNEQ